MVYLMSARQELYLRRRELLLLGHDIRVMLYLLAEPLVWSGEAMVALTGGTSKVLMFLTCMQIVGLQRPRAALLRCLLLVPPTLRMAMHTAQLGAQGVAGWVYRAKDEGGWWLLLVGVSYAALQVAIALVVSSWTDLWSRRGFIWQEHRRAELHWQQASTAAAAAAPVICAK